MVDRTTEYRAISNDRYSGRPLVPLLECYVMWAIGQLGEVQAAILAEMTSGLRSVYSAEGDWSDVITAAMGWRPDMPQKIRDAWVRHARLRGGGSALDAQAFAETFVDDNFVPRATPPQPMRKPGKPAVTALTAITAPPEY
jgi:hypothetical protein